LYLEEGRVPGRVKGRVPQNVCVCVCVCVECGERVLGACAALERRGGDEDEGEGELRRDWHLLTEPQSEERSLAAVGLAVRASKRRSDASIVT